MSDRNYTYHVDRGKFDLMLLQHANELGAKVYEGVNSHRRRYGSRIPNTPDVKYNDRPQGDEHQLPDGGGLPAAAKPSWATR